MVTDFHSHVLPGVDDGSHDLAESLALLRMEAAQGIRRVIATPHFYPHHDSPERFLARRTRAAQALQAAAASEREVPEILLGAEVYYHSGMSDWEILPQLCIGSSRHLLLEMPMGTWTRQMYREMEQIYLKQGIMPIIAHVDRYIAPFQTRGIPEALQDLPVLVQANAGFFLRSGTAAMALRMLKRQKIHLLGSDCHNITDRPPRLEEAVSRIRRCIGEDAISRICSYEQLVLQE